MVDPKQPMRRTRWSPLGTQGFVATIGVCLAVMIISVVPVGAAVLKAAQPVQHAAVAARVSADGGGAPSALTGVVKVVSDGSQSFCALLASGGAACWGFDLSGEVPIAVPVSGLTGAIDLIGDLDGGSYCALLSSGGVECWGDGELGQLGDGAASSSDVPVVVSGLTDAVGLAAQDSTVCAVLGSGGVECWGENETNGFSSPLGNGSTTGPDSCDGTACAATPVPVCAVGATSCTPSTNQLTGVAALGSEANCAVLTSGGVDCWGANNDGELGDGAMGRSASSTVPVPVSGVSEATSVAQSGGVNCALLSSGGVECWGTGDNGELGDGSEANSDVPVDTGLAGVTSLSGDSGYFCALSSSAQESCWGLDPPGDGSLQGPDTCTNNNINSPCSTSPISPSGAPEFTALQTEGEMVNCSVLTTGGVDCWGPNNNGEIGDGTTNNATVPTAASGITDATQVVGSWNATECAVLSSGEVNCWGANTLGNDTSGGSDVPVTVLFGEIPTVTSQPNDATTTSGQAVSFSAAADGLPAPGAQWQFITACGCGTWSNLSDGSLGSSVVSGSQTNTLTISNSQTNENNYQFRAVFTNDAGSVTSDPATLTVFGAPTASIASPVSGGTYALGQLVSTSFTCSEGSGGPGISSCADSNGSTSPGVLSTSTLGTFTYTVTATSSDGGTGTASITYTVVSDDVQISPNKGRPSKAVTLSGAGFQPDETVKVTYKTGLHAPKPSSVALCSAIVMSDGSFTCSGHIPASTSAGAAGSHQILAKGKTSLIKATTTFKRT
jgi:alpha-tubulin suppressor-like RCC1 family protein